MRAVTWPRRSLRRAGREVAIVSAMDGYEILGRVGEGSFGEVLRAAHRETGAVVALKRVRLRMSDAGARRAAAAACSAALLHLGCTAALPNTALREIRALRELDHPNVRAAPGLARGC